MYTTREVCRWEDSNAGLVGTWLDSSLDGQRVVVEDLFAGGCEGGGMERVLYRAQWCICRRREVTGKEEGIGELIVLTCIEGLGFRQEGPSLEFVDLVAALFAFFAYRLLAGDAGFEDHGETVQAYLASWIFNQEFQSSRQERSCRSTDIAVQYQRRRLNDHVETAGLMSGNARG